MNLVKQLQPDLLLLDIKMPVLSGVKLAMLLDGTGYFKVVLY